MWWKVRSKDGTTKSDDAETRTAPASNRERKRIWVFILCSMCNSIITMQWDFFAKIRKMADYQQIFALHILHTSEALFCKPLRNKMIVVVLADCFPRWFHGSISDWSFQSVAETWNGGMKLRGHEVLWGSSWMSTLTVPSRLSLDFVLRFLTMA